jgi:iron complex outermembrane receptor protein
LIDGRSVYTPIFGDTYWDTLRISADYFRQENQQGAFNPAFAGPPTPAFLDVTYHQVGGNILVDWNRKLDDDSSLQAKAYYSVEDREFLLSETRHTWDLELQSNFSAMENVAVTLGGNYRYTTDDFHGTPVGLPIAFRRDGDKLHFVSGFGQVQVRLFDDMVTLTAGTKLGYNNWSGFEYQPSGRITVAPVDGIVLWGAVSRAVKIPTQAERDVELGLPPVPPFMDPIWLSGDRDTKSEELLAFELGFRFFALKRFNMEVALFWNEYENRSSFMAGAILPTMPFPTQTVSFSNGAELTARGVEVEFNLLMTDWWRLKAAYSYVHMDEDLAGTVFSFGDAADDNPEHQFNIQSFFELPYGIEFDASVYYTDSVSGTVPTLETKSVGDYIRLDLRLGYKPADWVEFSLVGQNPTDRRHYESADFTAGRSTQVPRSGYAKVTVNF